VSASGPLSERSIILAPNGRDASIAAAILGEAGFVSTATPDLCALCRELDRGAGLAILAEEAVQTADLRALVGLLARQPPWSDLPVILLTRHGGGPERNPGASRLAENLGNVTFLERPFHPTTLASLVRTAVRSRRRQYDARSRIAELAESEGRLQTALTAGRLGSWTLDARGELEMSDTTRSQLGRRSQAGMSWDDLLACLPQEDRARLEASVAVSLETGEDVAAELRTLWPDGSTHWMEVRARAIRDSTEAVTGLVGVSSDITDRKAAELEREDLLRALQLERAALAELTRTLEARVEARSEQLLLEVAARERAQEQLRQAQKMESIGQLTGGVAHDFNNLLMAVIGNLDLLRRRTPDEPKLRRLIDGAMQGAQRGAALTQRLLAFARQQDLKAVPVDLSELLRGMAELLGRSLGPRVTLRFDISPDLPPAMVDANQLELAILNLAINSRDAMPDGGSIQICLDAAPQPPAPPLAAGDYLRIRIADTGSGMDEETLKKAIEPFFSTKPVGKGTGLGLSMVHGLAVQLGGRLDLESRPGEGVVATLWLPAATGAPEAAAPPFPARVPTRSARILVVDDDPLIAMSTVEMLEDLGHEVIEVDSGARALEVLKSSQPIDLMMTDHAMPEMSGAELARHARTVRPALPILLATGYADLEETEALALPRLSKPYHQAQLSAEIERLLAACA
jgi:PAS domain S-box-containing protein